MLDPVLAADGNAYERAAIERWFGRNPTSPLTNLPVEHVMLCPAAALRREISDWRQKNGMPDAPVPARAKPARAKPAPDTLLEALQAGDIWGVRERLALGDAPDQPDDLYGSLYVRAIAGDDEGALSELIVKTPNDRIFIEQAALLHAAAQYNATKCAEYLVYAGADTRATDASGETPFELAVRLNHLDVARAIHSARKNMTPRSPKRPKSAGCVVQ